MTTPEEFEAYGRYMAAKQQLEKYCVGFRGKLLKLAQALNQVRDLDKEVVLSIDPSFEVMLTQMQAESESLVAMAREVNSYAATCKQPPITIQTIVPLQDGR